MLVVFSGLPGTGKSALAHRVSTRLQASVLFSVDPIEAAMLRAGVRHSFESGLFAYLVVETLAGDELAARRSAIIDAVNAEEPAKEMWRALAAKHRVALGIVECVCSDEALHRQRLASRGQRFEGFPEPSWEDVLRRRAAFTRWTEPALRVDAVEPLDANVERAVAWLASTSSS